MPLMDSLVAPTLKVPDMGNLKPDFAGPTRTAMKSSTYRIEYGMVL